MVRLFTPLFARMIARGLARQHPGITPEQIAAAMRAEAGGRALGPDEERMIQAVVSRVPPKAEEAQEASPVSAWILFAANLVPVVGVLAWDWNAFALIALFWMENVVVGVFYVLRMLLVDPADLPLWLGKLFVVPFFCFHYGMFTAMHGLFVFFLFGDRKYAVSDLHRVLEPAARVAADYHLWLPLAVLVASHAFSFLWNYLYRGEYRSAQLKSLMTQPYYRVVVLHVGIILGGIGVAALGSPVWALIALLGMKIGLDWKAHVKEHSQKKA